MNMTTKRKNQKNKNLLKRVLWFSPAISSLVLWCGQCVWVVRALEHQSREEHLTGTGHYHCSVPHQTTGTCPTLLLPICTPSHFWWIDCAKIMIIIWVSCLEVLYICKKEDSTQWPMSGWYGSVGGPVSPHMKTPACHPPSPASPCPALLWPGHHTSGPVDTSVTSGQCQQCQHFYWHLVN